MIDERLSSLNLRKMVREPHTAIEPATFWWPVRRTNDWATKTQMVSSGACSTFVLPKRQPRYVNNDNTLIDDIYQFNIIIKISWLPLRQNICRTYIWARLAAQWLKCLIGHRKVAGLFPVSGSQIVFLNEKRKYPKGLFRRCWRS